MRKVNLGSIFRLGRSIPRFCRALGLNESSCQFRMLWPLGFCLIHVFSYAGCSTEPHGTMCAEETMRLFNSPNKKF